MSKKNPEVDAYLNKASQWQKEMKKLRAIALGCGLTEELKWGKPCYTYEGNNIIVLQGFKESCALLFTQGALLKDAKGILEKPGPNSNIGRRIRFTTVSEIVTLETTLSKYIKEAINATKAGLKVITKKTPDPLPEELKSKFNDIPALESAFFALTPGRQRHYVLHFSSAKQPKTRLSRIEKCIPSILAGKGLND